MNKPCSVGHSSLAVGGTVASTASPLATDAALAAMAEGGNAFDGLAAAIAVLFAALPMSCGLGGDLAIMGYGVDDRDYFGLCALGRAPMAATPARFCAMGLTAIPQRGILSATAPAALPGLEALIGERCRLPRTRLFAPAIDTARALTVDRRFAKWTANNIATVRGDAQLSATYLVDNEPYAPGAVVRQSAMAETLSRVASDAGYGTSRAWYEALVAASERGGGLFDIDDFAAPTVDRALIERTIAGHRVLATPLPTQGHVMLRSLAVYDRIAARSRPAEADRIHLLSEIFNRTYAERLEHAGDPQFVDHMDALTDAAGDAAIAAQVDPSARSRCPYAGWYNPGDTTQLVVGDGAGNAACAIASLSLGFGAGVMDRETGVIFNNRLGRSATLNPRHANVVAPGKRPVNTIHLFMVAGAERPLALGGTPGGDGQVQWTCDLLSKMLVHGVPGDAAIAEPRFTHFPGAERIEVDGPATLQIEDDDPALWADLRSLGHEVVRKNKVQGALRILSDGGDGWIAMDDGHDVGSTRSAS